MCVQVVEFSTAYLLRSDFNDRQADRVSNEWHVVGAVEILRTFGGILLKVGDHRNSNVCDERRVGEKTSRPASL